MPTALKMARNAHESDSSIKARDAPEGNSALLAHVKTNRVESKRAIPEQLRRSLDEIFMDADRHGPRLHRVTLRVAPSVALTALMLWVTMNQSWREFVVENTSQRLSDLILVAPVLAAMMILAAVCAPLVRMRALPVVLMGLALLAISSLMVYQGAVVHATVVALCGALLVGVASARIVRRAVWVLPLLLSAGLSDAHSVASGVTENLLSEVQSTAAQPSVVTSTIDPSMISQLDYMVLHVPVATGIWMLGIVDVVAIGLMLALTHLHWRSVSLSALAITAALILAVSAGTAVPVLPVIGIAWIVTNASLVWNSTRFTVRRVTYLGG